MAKRKKQRFDINRNAGRGEPKAAGAAGVTVAAQAGAEAACGAAREDVREEAGDPEQELKSMQNETVGLLVRSYEALNNLSEVRQRCKLSNSRVAGVAREMRELIKVMSVYAV